MLCGRKCFCRECGAHLFSRNPDDPEQMSVRMGAFDGDPGVRPSWRAYLAYAAPWEAIRRWAAAFRRGKAAHERGRRLNALRRAGWPALELLLRPEASRWHVVVGRDAAVAGI